MEHAAPDTFEIRALSVNDRDALVENGLTVVAKEPVEISGEIEFSQQPPGVASLRIVRPRGERVIIHSAAAIRLERTTGRRARFSATLNAPQRPGEYTLLLISLPPAWQEIVRDEGQEMSMEVYFERSLVVTE